MRILTDNKLITSIFIIIITSTGVNCLAQFAGGVGTAEDPWQISTPGHLDNIRDYLGAAHSNKYFIQINNIDLGTAPWNSGQGWVPIGDSIASSFRGHYDGNYYTIGNLTIISPDENHTGLFGYIVGGKVFNLNLENISISGLNRVGGLAGNIEEGIINRCSVNGHILGNDNVGGLAGIINRESEISESFSDVAITARLRAGGLAGTLFSGSTMINCFAVGDIDGASGSIGGLIGRGSYSLVKNSYSTGSVSTPSPFLGGLIGSQQGNSLTVTGSYWNTETSGLDTSSGGEGRTTEQMTYPYSDDTYVDWDFEEIWQEDEQYSFNQGYPYLIWIMGDIPGNLTAQAGEEMITINWQPPVIREPQSYNIYRNNELIANIEDTEYEDRNIFQYHTYTYFVTACYPDNEESASSNKVRAVSHPIPAFTGAGTPANPYRVECAGQLHFMQYHEDAIFLQTSNIDLGEEPWSSYQGWQPIGHFVDDDYPGNSPFTGRFNGNGYVISNLTIDREYSDYQGLFGYIQDAVMENIRLRNVRVKGHKYVGGLAGYARDSIIEQCYVKGSISGTGDYTGGLAGYSLGTDNFILNSFTNVNVSGAAYTGGLLGYSTTTTHSVRNCYATGSVRGISNCVGGLIGYSWGDVYNSYSTGYVATTDTVYIGGLIGRSDYGTVFNSYWDVQTSSQDVSAGGTAKTTVEMVEGNTFEGWDFADVWRIEENRSYPYFTWQEEPGSQNIPGPYDLKAVAGSAVVRMTWQAPEVGTVLQYKLYRDNQLLAHQDASITQYTDNTVTNFETYRYSVTAILDNQQETVSSNPAVVTPFTFPGGDGTINDPYLVEDAAQLYAVKSQLDGHFQQINDIDLKETEWGGGRGWQPIGASAIDYFTGSYDGGGYKIFNLTVNNPDTDYQGLFGYVNGGTIRNLGIVNGNITGRSHVGGLAGRLSDDSFVEDCFYQGNVTASGTNVGGLIGTNINSRINNCFTYGKIMGNSHNAGGLVGWNEYSIIDNSYSFADVEVIPVTDFLTYDVGGLVGFNINNSLIRNCRAGGNVTAVLARRVGGLVGDNSITEGETGSTIIDSYATGNVLGDSWVGGLAGRNFSTPAAVEVSVIENSYATGAVHALHHNAGGLVARNDNAVIKASFSTSDITVQSANSPYNQGGLVGRNTIGAEIHNCYAMGEVHGHARVGGLVGDNYRDTGEEVIITNSYATGRLSRTGSLPIGGLTARNEGGTVTNSFWDTNTSNISESAAGEGKETSRMTYPYANDVFQDWDFQNLWRQDSLGTQNNGYPYFYWQRFINEVSIGGPDLIYVPVNGENKYDYDFRIYDREGRTVPGAAVIWRLEDGEDSANAAEGYVTMDVLGCLTVSSGAQEGAFIITAVSETDENIYSRINVILEYAEVNPYPAAAVNPYPQHRAEEVDIDMEKLQWQYIEDEAYQNPAGFKLYFAKDELCKDDSPPSHRPDALPRDDFEWIPYHQAEQNYYYELSQHLDYSATYFWKIVPTTQIPGRAKRSDSSISRYMGKRTLNEGRRSMFLADNPDKMTQITQSKNIITLKETNNICETHYPVWSFTTKMDTSVEDDEVNPYPTALYENYPNPFNPYTTITFSIKEASQVTVTIFNSRGQKVNTLTDDYFDPGIHRLKWDGRNERSRPVSSGVYFYRMKTRDFRDVRKMLLVK